MKNRKIKIIKGLFYDYSIKNKKIKEFKHHSYHQQIIDKIKNTPRDEYIKKWGEIENIENSPQVDDYVCFLNRSNKLLKFLKKHKYETNTKRN